jgi:hypothetical protein
MVAALIEEAEAIVTDGIDARLAHADANAAAIAAAEREELIELRGRDVNHAEDRIARIREIAD